MGSLSRRSFPFNMPGASVWRAAERCGGAGFFCGSTWGDTDTDGGVIAVAVVKPAMSKPNAVLNDSMTKQLSKVVNGTQ
jgi:hypothetical protein